MKIGLLWHSFSSGNLGVGALSISNMLLIDQAARDQGVVPEFMLIGSSGGCEYPPENSNISHSFIEFNEDALLKNPYKLFRAIKSCDVIFDIGEGDSFSDIYGNKRLLKLLLSKSMAYIGGVPIVISPQTIGPFKSPWSRKASEWIMKRALKVFARDHISFSILKEMNVLHRDEVIDVAFHLPYFCQKEVRNERCLAIGLNVSALLYHGGYEGESNQFGLSVDYKALTEILIEKLLDAGHEVHLVPHVIPQGFPAEDDYAVSVALKEKYPKILIADRFLGPVEAKSYISSLDFFVGARMHATIGAYSALIPVVPLAYSRKFAGLYESINYSHVIDLRVETTNSVVDKIMTCLKQRDNLRAEIVLGSQIVKERLASYKLSLEDIIKYIKTAKLKS